VYVNTPLRSTFSYRQTLAESDLHEVVADVKEMPSDFLAVEPHVFVVAGAERPIRNLVS
jgi:hypothetical protein